MEARNRFIIARDNVLFAENTFLKEKTKVENVNSQISWISKRPDFVKRLLRFCETSDQGKHRGLWSSQSGTALLRWSRWNQGGQSIIKTSPEMNTPIWWLLLTSEIKENFWWWVGGGGKHMWWRGGSDFYQIRVQQ